MHAVGEAVECSTRGHHGRSVCNRGCNSFRYYNTHVVGVVLPAIQELQGIGWPVPLAPVYVQACRS